MRSYTWSQTEPLIFSRLDYWLISNFLSDNVINVNIISSIKTDHSAIVFEFQNDDDIAKGHTYVDEINRLIPRWVSEGVLDLSDSRSVWDWAEYNIKIFSRKYLMGKCKQRRLDEQRLHIEFQEANLSFQNYPSQENLAKLNVLKEQMEKFYEKKKS